MDNLPGQSAARNDRFRLGLVGVGRMGKTHLAAIKTSPGISVEGVAEPRQDGREALSHDGVRAFESLEEMLENCELDGVLVAAPTGAHLEIVRRLMAAGLPVLCEKPCGLTVAEATECAKVTEEAGGTLQVAYWRRFVPQLQELRERMARGEFGDILAVGCYQWDAAPPPLEFRAGSGGILVDMGVHEFDQVRWLTGQEFGPVKVAVSRVGASAGDPDCAQIVAELDGGGTAAVSLGRWHPAGDSCKVDVFGTKATESIWFLEPSTGDAVFLQALKLQVEDFVRSVTFGESAGASVTDAVEALKVAELASEAVLEAS